VNVSTGDVHNNVGSAADHRETIMPTVIREFARAGAGEVSTIASGAFSSGTLLTAVRNGSDNLELIVWAPDSANRGLTRLSDSGTQAGEVGGIALAMMSERCITAVQNGDGNLLLIPWALEPDGTISRLEVVDHQAGKASYIAIMPLSDSVLVTPCRNGAGNLLIIPWSLDVNGHISRLDNGPGQGGSVADGSTTYVSNQTTVSVPLGGALIAGAAIDGSNFVTAKINKSGGLELAAWALNASNQPTKWWGSAVLEGLADNLCMAPLPGPEHNFILAYRRITPVVTGQNVTLQTKVIVSVWAPSTSTGSVTTIAHATADELGDVSLTVGSIGPAGRPLVFLSGHVGYDRLVNLAFEVITDGSSLALILTGQVHDDSFRNIGQIAPVSLVSGQFATTLGNDDGFGLVAYNLSDLSATLVRPLAEATDDQATAIRVRALNPDQAIVALRNESGNLELIGWDVTAPDFAVTRAADTSGHPIAALDVALVVRGQQAVTAIHAGSGHLRLDSWNIAADLSSIAWVHETGTAAGGADLITATLLEPDLVVTAVRNLSGNLLLIVWRIESDGTLSRLNHEDAQAGEIDLIALTALDASNVVTAVRDGSGNLLVIGWTIGSNGTVTRWNQDGHAGEVGEIAAVALDGADSTKNIVTAVRDGSDGLLVIVWRASVGDRTITRLTDSGEQGHDDGNGTNIAVCVCQSSPSLRPTIVTSRRRGGGSLKLTTWQLLDDASGVPMLIETGDMTNRADLDVTLTDLCALEPGRVAVAANVGMKDSKGLWLSTMKVSDAQIPFAPANILTLTGFTNPSPPDDWANDGGDYPLDKPFEWQQVLEATNEYDDTPVGVSGWVVKPEESGGDVPFSHPFGFDWEFDIAVEKGFEGFISPANVTKEEENGGPNANSIALADQLGLTTPLGLLGLEWEKQLLPRSYRGQVNHGDRVAVLGRWILDNGHNVDGQFRTEIHPPLLLASANVVHPADGGVLRTRALFISRPYLSGQIYTNNLGTRYQDGVDNDGPLLSPILSSHGFRELIRVLAFGSTQIEMHSKIKEKPFRGNHRATFTVCPPGPRPTRDAQLLVSYRFNVRTPCQVRLQLSPTRDGIDVTVDLLEKGRDGRTYQAPALPVSRSENYSTDQLDLLSPGDGDTVGLGLGLIEFASTTFLSGIYALYLKGIFENGIETDVFDPQPQFDILDPTGGVKDVPAGQIVPGAGIIEGDKLAYPITGWVEVCWASPAGT
jgi:hypothetical protein